MSEYKVGSIIKGQVTGIEKYGIFMNIDPWYDGLIHISEISDGFVRDVNDYVKVGETIYCQIIEVDEENLQLKLSIKNINYKTIKGHNAVKESKSGFLPLKRNLEKWIRTKLEDYKKNN